MVVTQPRRLAAQRLAERVSAELGSRESCGYKLRFDDTTGERTKIKYVTDGVLVGEARIDPRLEDYR